MPDAEADPGLVEGASRWLAARSTRRSFLGRLGRAAVLVASGSAVASLVVADEAEARVCGQSGVSPKCPTYDCDAIWGWCWYATGCCANGGLKKICDCCAVDWPNVHGYCPTGTNVKCIVESCGTDPRVQTVALSLLRHDDPVRIATEASRSRFGPGSLAEAWVVSRQHPLAAAVAAPAAARAGSVVLLSDGDHLPAPVVAEIQRLGATRVVLFGPGLGSAVEDDAARYAAVERREDDGDLAAVSARVAAAFLDAGVDRAVCVEPAGVSGRMATVAGAAAAAAGMPLLVGVGTAAAASTGERPRTVLTYLAGPEAAARAGEVAGGHPLRSGTPASLASELLDVVGRVERVPVERLSLVAEQLAGASDAGLVAFGGPVLVHAAGTLDGARDALFAHRGALRAVALAGATGALSTEAYYSLQSVVNGFEAHLLIGVGGQGLPVIPQPVSERPLGRARVAGAPDQPSDGYWTGRVSRLEP